MKHLALVVFAYFSLLSTRVNAQAELPLRRPLLFGDFQVNLGTAAGAHLGIATLLRERHEIGIAAAVYGTPSTGFPDDFDCPTCKHGFGNDFMQGAAITYGYALYPGSRQRFLRITLRAGVLLGQERIADDFVRIANPGPREENYSFNDDPRFGAALLLRPTVDLAFNGRIGLTLGPFAILSPNFNGMGGSIGIRFGQVGSNGLRPRLRELQKAREQQALKRSEAKTKRKTAR